MGRGPRAARRAAAAATSRPLRTCVACRATRAQQDLVRITVRDGRLVPDAASRMPGRGAYLCPSAECAKVATAREAQLLRRSLRVRTACALDPALIALTSPTSGTTSTSDGTDGATAP
jgi:uncharacterized protein